MKCVYTNDRVSFIIQLAVALSVVIVRVYNTSFGSRRFPERLDGRIAGLQTSVKNLFNKQKIIINFHFIKSLGVAIFLH